MFFSTRLMALCASALCFQQQQTSSEKERESDVYRIYSLLMSNPSTSHGPDNNPQYLIAATTNSGASQPPCVRPPKEREEEFEEVLADFANRNATPRILQRQLSISKPYELLTAELVNAFRNSRFPPRGGETFAGVADLFTLADVYFSKSGRLALTAVSTWCGGLCGKHQWKVLEKPATGEWQERPWVTCFSIADRSRRIFADAAPKSFIPVAAGTGYYHYSGFTYLCGGRSLLRTRPRIFT